MKNISNKSNRRPRNRYAIFYKSHGEYIGPYNGFTLSKKEVQTLSADGTLNYVSNYVLRSPLQLRRRVA